MNKSKPILFQICVEGNRGSTGRIAESIGMISKERGWESYIAYGRFPRPSASKLIRIESNFGVIIHALKTRIFDLHGYGSKKATKKLIRKISIINPDIIHLHHIHGYYINLKILFDFLSTYTIPVVWTFHDCWSITGHCAYFDNIGCDKWKIECNHCPLKKEYPTSWFIDRSKKNFLEKKALFTSVKNLTIISVSKWLKSIVEESFMSKSAQYVIYNGIDINIFNPEVDRDKIRKLLKIEDRFLILGVANPWGNRKGFKDFLKLSKIIKEDEVIVLIGLNSKELRGLPQNIVGLARTENQKQLQEIYATADVYINLSVEETFGLTIAESLACGTPAIVYNVTACPEIIDINTGIVIEKHNITEVYRAIQEIKNNGKQFYTHECRKRAVELYNKDDKYNEYVDLYNELCRTP